MQTINVTISPTGEIAYDVKGVKGADCEKLTKAIDELAGRVVEHKRTAEYNQTTAGQQRQGQ